MGTLAWLLIAASPGINPQFKPDFPTLLSKSNGSYNNNKTYTNHCILILKICQ